VEPGAPVGVTCRNPYDRNLARNERPPAAPVRNDPALLRKEPALRQVSGGP